MKTHDDWDGVPRINTLLHGAFGATDDKYSRLLSRMLMGKLYDVSQGKAAYATPTLLLLSDTLGSVTRSLELLALGKTLLYQPARNPRLGKAIMSVIPEAHTWEQGDVARQLVFHNPPYHMTRVNSQVVAVSHNLNNMMFVCQAKTPQEREVSQRQIAPIDCRTVNLAYVVANRFQLWQEASRCSRNLFNGFQEWSDAEWALLDNAWKKLS